MLQAPSESGSPTEFNKYLFLLDDEVDDSAVEDLVEGILVNEDWVEDNSVDVVWEGDGCMEEAPMEEDWLEVDSL